MKWSEKLGLGLAIVATFFATVGAPSAKAEGNKPNIVVIMGDDIGMWNIGAYHRGLMAGQDAEPRQARQGGHVVHRLLRRGELHGGPRKFITGELPIRTGMTTVGQAGAKIGLPAEAVTIATILKSMGYATGQFGKNHLGDRNEFLPCVHGFDEFFGYLYHLDAMEDPAHPNYPQNLLSVVGPRNMVHCWATDKDDPTDMPRWGEIGKQKIEDAGPLYPKRMETVDDEIRDLSIKFIEKAKKDNKPFFVWLNPTRMHIVTHLSPKYEALRNRGEWLVGRRSRHGATGRRRRHRNEEAEGHGRRRQHNRRCSPPTTARNSLPGPMAVRRHSRSPREQSSRAASAYLRSFAGPVMYRRTPCRTASSPAWTGFLRSSRRPVIQTSPKSC